MAEMNDHRKAPRWAVAVSIAVCLPGVLVLFLVCQAFYAALILRMRVFFPFILSPVIAAVGLWWLLAPWVTLRHYGRGALINLIAGAVTAGILFGSMFALFL